MRYWAGVLALMLAACGARGEPWVGVHVMAGGRDSLEKIQESLPGLKRAGVNALIVEVDYNYDFQSHPELRSGAPITRRQAQAFGQLCRRNGIRVIPSLNCLGHQSWSSHNGALLAKHPDFDETPGKYPDNKGIYCRSWCPLNPEVRDTVMPLIDELIDGFGADAFHVGMDEVFIIGSDDCPRCKGKDPARLFARQVNDLYDHIVVLRKKEMMMWGDRLLDAKAMGYSKWEASDNKTFAAADMIPKDIVICDWHYEQQKDYPSVHYLLEKGFKVWPAGWHNEKAAEALLETGISQHSPKMMGYLSTTWGKVKLEELGFFPPTIMAGEKLGTAGKQ